MQFILIHVLYLPPDPAQCLLHTAKFSKLLFINSVKQKEPWGRGRQRTAVFYARFNPATSTVLISAPQVSSETSQATHLPPLPNSDLVKQ